MAVLVKFNISELTEDDLPEADCRIFAAAFNAAGAGVFMLSLCCVYALFMFRLFCLFFLFCLFIQEFILKLRLCCRPTGAVRRTCHVKWTSHAERRSSYQVHGRSSNQCCEESSYQLARFLPYRCAATI